MPAAWMPTIVWTDFRLAVLFLVILPLVFLIWALVKKNEAIQRLLMIYWRVASLLGITVYLLLAAIPIGFISGWLARILIPLALWFWVDLNEEIAEQPKTSLKTAFTSWRWAVSIYNGLGAIVLLPALRCAFISAEQVVNDSFCRLWLEPAWAYKAIVHPNTRAPFLGFLAVAALVIYILYLGYFVFFRLGKQGRSAVEQ